MTGFKIIWSSWNKLVWWHVLPTRNVFGGEIRKKWQKFKNANRIPNIATAAYSMSISISNSYAQKPRCKIWSTENNIAAGSVMRKSDVCINDASKTGSIFHMRFQSPLLTWNKNDLILYIAMEGGVFKSSPDCHNVILTLNVMIILFW